MSNKYIYLTFLFVLSSNGLSQGADDLPRLGKGIDASQYNYNEQQKAVDLPKAYVSTSPKDLGDGLTVGTLDVPGTKKAVTDFVAADKEGKYENLDSLLLWKDGKLIFEMYNRKGRVDAPHYAMSITKTLTSVTLARAIQCGLLSVEDLDKPVINFMPEIDKTKIKPGVDTITLRDALYMKSGLRYQEKSYARKLGSKYQGQKYFQKLFEETDPVTPKSKQFKYIGTDPSMIMMIIDIKTRAAKMGTAQEFIAKEVAAKFGVVYNWDNQGCGIPKCGAGSSFTSRALLKIGTSIIQGGQYNGEQLLSADYIKLVMAPKEKEGYYFFFHNRIKTAGSSKVKFISGVGAGGQYMATFPELNIVMVATSTRNKSIAASLQAALDHFIPLFTK